MLVWFQRRNNDTQLLTQWPLFVVLTPPPMPNISQCNRGKGASAIPNTQLLVLDSNDIFKMQ